MNTQSKRLVKTFATLAERNKKALIPFITTGDPIGVDVTDLMHALVDGGADIIELGMPFSDPAADGETIQHASERAISNGYSHLDSLEAVKAFRKTDNTTPVILMGYLNPTEIHTKGFAGFAHSVSESGADALILVDLSYESGAEYRKVLRANQIDLVNLVAPTTSKTRLGRMLKNAGGFVYYVSMRGVTGNAGQGGQGLDTEEISQAVTLIKEKCDLPVCVGFGINDGETAKKVAEYADGVVVGSALVKTLYNAAQENKNVLDSGRDFITSIRQTMDK